MGKLTVAVAGSFIAAGLLAVGGPFVTSTDSFHVTADPVPVSVTEDKIW